MPGDVYVRAAATPGDLGGGDGSLADPFHSVEVGIRSLQNSGGGIVRLFGGTHFIESVVLDSISGLDEENRIVVCPVAGSGEVFIDSCLPEFLAPNGRWIEVAPPHGVSGEYIWPDRFDFPGARIVHRGAFFDWPGHARLVSYDRVEDLRSARQEWPQNEGDNRVFVPNPNDPNDPPTTFVPQFVDGKPTRRPWVYMGPGIWFDPSPEPDIKDASGKVVSYGGRHVHIRLAKTTNHVPNWADYEGESSPNDLRLALSMDQTRALFLKSCRHIKFEHLTLRFGSPETVLLNNCSDIVFDHCRIRSGSRAIFLNVDGDKPHDENRDILVEHCEIDGGIPTWFFRSDRKDVYRYGPEDKDLVTEDETTDNQLGHATSGVQLSGRARSFNVVVHHCEIFNAHDSYIFGDGMSFHHNWVRNLNDDGIAVSADAQTKNAKIFCNVMTKCLTALSFAARRLDVVYIYGNLFDLREPTLGIRPSGPDTGVTDSLRQGHFFKDGADEGPIELFHNTCVVLDPGANGTDFSAANDAGFSYYVTIGKGEDPRRAFNNILVAAFTPGQVKPIAFLAPKSFSCQTNGNTFFRVPQEDDEDNFLVRRRNGPPGTNESVGFATLDDYRLHYWPNDTAHEYEHDSRLEDPGFRSFDTDTGAPHQGDDLRLGPRTPANDPEAWRAAVALPDLLRDMYVAATGTVPTDRGCYPPTGARLKVGVDGRRIYPPV